MTTVEPRPREAEVGLSPLSGLAVVPQAATRDQSRSWCIGRPTFTTPAVSAGSDGSGTVPPGS